LQYQINHETKLEFLDVVHEHQCEMRLSPRDDPHQHLKSFVIETDPPAKLSTYIDAFGNRVHHFSVIAPHRVLLTRVLSEVETRLENPFDYPLLSPEAEKIWYETELRQHPELWQYVLHQSPATPAWSSLEITGLRVPERDPAQSIQTSLVAAMNWVHETLAYRPGATQVHTPLAEVLKTRAGVCQDFAHLLISLIRSWQLPVRYVMGYLDPGFVDRENLKGEQASHAWVEVLIPGAGWRGLDATHRLMANHTYIPVAVGRDYLDAAPQRGSFKGGSPGQSPRIKLLVARQGQ
jgi:transglutaminase-like putative cysteine protease